MAYLGEGGPRGEEGDDGQVADETDEGTDGSNKKLVDAGIESFGNKQIDHPAKVVSQDDGVTFERESGGVAVLEIRDEDDDQGANNADGKPDPFPFFFFLAKEDDAAYSYQDGRSGGDERSFKGGGKVKSDIKEGVAKADLDKFDNSDGEDGFEGEVFGPSDKGDGDEDKRSGKVTEEEEGERVEDV